MYQVEKKYLIFIFYITSDFVATLDIDSDFQRSVKNQLNLSHFFFSKMCPISVGSLENFDQRYEKNKHLLLISGQSCALV